MEERAFVQEAHADVDVFKRQDEGLWVLAWSLGLTDTLDFWRDCDPRFVHLLPDLRS